MAIKPDGSLHRQIKIEKPFAIQIDQNTGALYVSSADWHFTRNMHHAVNRTLTKATADGTVVASVKVVVSAGHNRRDLRFAGLGAPVPQRARPRLPVRPRRPRLRAPDVPAGDGTGRALAGAGAGGELESEI